LIHVWRVPVSDEDVVAVGDKRASQDVPGHSMSVQEVSWNPVRSSNPSLADFWMTSIHNQELGMINSSERNRRRVWNSRHDELSMKKKKNHLTLLLCCLSRSEKLYMQTDREKWPPTLQTSN